MNISADRTLIARFWRKVRKTGKCWLWIGAHNKRGYGMIRVLGRLESAHRTSWRIHKGPIPPGMNVLHECDNPACIRPDHLFTGTYLDNSADCISKGRNKNPPIMAKVTPEQVIEIRASAERKAVLVQRYGVSRNQIWMIQSGRSWPETAKRTET